VERGGVASEMTARKSVRRDVPRVAGGGSSKEDEKGVQEGLAIHVGSFTQKRKGLTRWGWGRGRKDRLTGGEK